MNCRRHGLTYDPAIVAYLQRRYYGQRKIQMRGCHPRDLIDHVVSICRYRKIKAELTPELLDAACRTYFIDEPQPAGTQAS